MLSPPAICSPLRTCTQIYDLGSGMWGSGLQSAPPLRTCNRMQTRFLDLWRLQASKTKAKNWGDCIDMKDQFRGFSLSHPDRRSCDLSIFDASSSTSLPTRSSTLAPAMHKFRSIPKPLTAKAHCRFARAHSLLLSTRQIFRIDDQC